MQVGKLEVKLSIDDKQFKEELEALKMTMDYIELDQHIKEDIIERLTKCLKVKRPKMILTDEINQLKDIDDEMNTFIMTNNLDKDTERQMYYWHEMIKLLTYEMINKQGI